MSNYIKIPIDVSRPFKPASFALSGTATGGGTVGPASGTATASDAQIISGGSGSGAQATILQGSGNNPAISAATITITNSGQGYKVDDVITIPIIAASGQKTSTSVLVSYTILEGDLADTASTPEEMIPVDNVLALDASGDDVKLMTNIVSDSNAICFWTVKINLNGTSVNDALIAIDEEWRKSVQAENSQPSVEFPAGISAYNVTFTTT